MEPDRAGAFLSSGNMESSIGTTTQGNLAVLIHSLVGGGAERTAALLATHWSESGHRVTLITLDSAEATSHPLGDRVERVGLRLMRHARTSMQGARNNALRVLRLRQAVKQCHASLVISFTDQMNVLALLATAGLQAGVIINERSDPRRHRMPRAWSWLRRRLYPKCRCLVVQTESLRTWAAQTTRGRPVYVVPNAAPRFESTRGDANATSQSDRRVVALGRLSAEKGFDRLISAFAAVASRFPNWRLSIYGTGPQQQKLLGLCGRYQLDAQSVLPGWVSDVERVLNEADLFVLPSRYEGFPNALLEAMASGLACISFDCDSGPRHIVRHGIDGLLVPADDTNALADAMARVMSDQQLRDELGGKAREVRQRFGREQFFRRWDAILAGASQEVFADLGPSTQGDPE
jgi:glycosyltransferase involved in cell wall biosynthesis